MSQGDRKIKKKTIKTTAHQDAENLPIQDTRVIRSKQLVLKVTWDLLSENGLGGVSVDEVARRSGVAKTTIYRHWATRSDLLIEACSQISSTQEVPNKGSLKADITALLNDLAHMLCTARWSSVLPSVIDSAERDPAIAEVHSRLQRAHAAPFRAVIDRAIKAKELPQSSDPGVMTAALVGPLFYRRWFSREPLDDKFIKTVITNVLG
jgi:AcrR family transcriptional regulator